jgi:DNA-binding NarL/FixJ family response regulator
LLKQTSSRILGTAIREVLKGSTFYCPSISKRVLPHSQTPAPPGGPLKKSSNRLSSREVEVLQLIAEGKANKQVAAELGLSFKTIDKHRQHLMAKLNIHDTAGLTRYVISAGIIESSVQVTIL